MQAASRVTTSVSPGANPGIQSGTPASDWQGSLQMTGWLVQAAWLLALVASLTACSNLPPELPVSSASSAPRLGLKLPPAALGAALALQQHLTVERFDGTGAPIRTDELDVALEIDAKRLNLVGLALGQRVMSLQYDGSQLQSWRHLLLPAAVRPDDVLEDIMLTLWPLDAIRNALPTGWRIEEQGLQRTLFMGQTVVAQIRYSNLPRWQGTVILDNLRWHYRLTIQSAPSSP